MSRGRPEGDYGPRLSDSWPGVYDPASLPDPDEGIGDGDPWLRDRPGQRPDPTSGREGRPGRGGGAKRGRDRRPGAELGPAGQAADEDYDWIKYLGDGRSSSPASPAGSREPAASPSPRLSRPVGRPRKDLPERRPDPGFGLAGPREPRGALPPAPRSVPPPQPQPTQLPVRRPPVPPDPITDPGPGARRVPPADYRQPLYQDYGPDQEIPASGRRQAISRPAPPEPSWLDSQEYKRPLYPPDGSGPDATAPGRRRAPALPSRTTGPGGRPDPLGLPAPAGRRALPAPGRVDSDDNWIASRATPDTDLRVRGRNLRDELTQRSLPAPADRTSIERRPLDDQPAPRDVPRAPARTAPPAKKARPGAGRKPRKPSSPAKPRTPARRPAAPTRKRTATPAAKRGAGLPRSVRTVVRLPRRLLIAGGCLVLVLVAAAAYFVLRPQPAHVVATPSQLGAFAESSTVDSHTAQALRSRIVAGAAGEVKNVVAAVYERTTGPGTSLGPQIVVFIGGNLTGSGSASGFIGGLVNQMHGSFTTNPGKLGGQAACVPGSSAGPAECAWADNDTFGVIVSATLSAAGLADEMRAMRPLIEHAVK